VQADKLQSLISAAKVPDVEPIWTTLFAKALEGKDVKEMLTNVGGGGAAPAAAAAAPAAAGGAAPEAAAAPEEKKKEEGTFRSPSAPLSAGDGTWTNTLCREGGVGRGHGLRSLRLSVSRQALWWKARHGEGVALDGARGYAVIHGYASSILALNARLIARQTGTNFLPDLPFTTISAFRGLLVSRAVHRVRL